MLLLHTIVARHTGAAASMDRSREWRVTAPLVVQQKQQQQAAVVSSKCVCLEHNNSSSGSLQQISLIRRPKNMIYACSLLYASAAAVAVCTAMAASPAASPRVLVVGGSGRVGGSTVRALHKYHSTSARPLDLRVGGRSEANFRSSLKVC
jgi:hypothetical protein